MRKAHALLLAATAFVGLPSVVLATDGAVKDQFEYRTPGGITIMVTPEGLTEIRVNGRAICHGGWRFQNAGKRWKQPEGPDTSKIKSKAIEVVSPTEARVTHIHDNASIRYAYRFNGEDLRIEAYVENRHPSESIHVTEFEGPWIAFGQVPIGILPNMHYTYTADGGIAYMHPGAIRFGGSFVIGKDFGIGVAPHQAAVVATALLWEWDWGVREASPSRQPLLFIHAPIPALGARTFSVTFRVSTSTDWKHLLDPYRQHLYATHGATPKYDRTTNFPIVQSCVNGSEQDRNPVTNPYAYSPGRRLDSINGVVQLHGKLAPTMKAIQSQGLLIWGQSGMHARGAMYRPDFDALPPETALAMPRLAQFFHEQNMRVGVGARPNQVVQPIDWKTDTVSMLDTTNPAELAMIARRFTNMMAMGYDLFYLDSFGQRIEDVTIMRAIRSGIGKQPGIGSKPQTFVESPSDVIMPYSGFLAIVNGSMADDSVSVGMAGPFCIPQSHPPTFSELCRYLYPDAPVLAMVSQVAGVETPEAQRKLIEFCFKNRMAPLIPDFWCYTGSKMAQWLPPLTAQYLTPDGQWKQ